MYINIEIKLISILFLQFTKHSEICKIRLFPVNSVSNESSAFFTLIRLPHSLSNDMQKHINLDYNNNIIKNKIILWG